MRHNAEAWSAILDSLIRSTDVESCRPITQAASLRLPRGFHGHCRAPGLTLLWGAHEGNLRGPIAGYCILVADYTGPELAELGV
jgi:hypothetical protein